MWLICGICPIIFMIFTYHRDVICTKINPEEIIQNPSDCLKIYVFEVLLLSNLSVERLFMAHKSLDLVIQPFEQFLILQCASVDRTFNRKKKGSHEDFVSPPTMKGRQKCFWLCVFLCAFKVIRECIDLTDKCLKSTNSK